LTPSIYLSISHAIFHKENNMSKTNFTTIARPLVSCPTAPFHEHFALSQIYDFAHSRPAIKITQDAYGNLLLLYNGTKKKCTRLIATAHLDHPGLLWKENIDERHFAFELFGGVKTALLKDESVLIYHLNRGRKQKPSKAQIVAVETTANKRTRAVLETQRPLSASPAEGTFATWDFPAWKIRGNRLHARVCDDLVGASVGLSFLDELQRKDVKTRAGLLLTRGEEVGFVGMIAAIKSGNLDPDALYINIECSSIKAGATMGQGPVIRVGDRIHIFDPSTSAALVAVAEEMEKKSTSFKFQRRLMDAGACEATPLVHAGLRTGAVALPLGNYHNDGGDRLKAEVIDLNDAHSLVDLFVTLSSISGGIDAAIHKASTQLENHLSQRLASHKPRLQSLSFSARDYPL
jgi:putative aminopeptidase FrvX